MSIVYYAISQILTDFIVISEFLKILYLKIIVSSKFLIFQNFSNFQILAISKF